MELAFHTSMADREAGQPLLPGHIAALNDADWWTKLGKYMPTGTFMVFQAIAPIITNNGNCSAEWHKIVTGIVLVALAAACMFLAFTDSVVEDSVLYYGLATSSGMRVLYPPGSHPLGNLGSYKLSELPPLLQHSYFGYVSLRESCTAVHMAWHAPDRLEVFHCTGLGDWLHAVMSAAVFLGLSIITPPVSSCFTVTVSFMDPNLFTALATVVGAVASSATFLKGISGPPRHGLGFASFMQPPNIRQ